LRIGARSLGQVASRDDQIIASRCAAVRSMPDNFHGPGATQRGVDGHLPWDLGPRALEREPAERLQVAIALTPPKGRGLAVPEASQGLQSIEYAAILGNARVRKESLDGSRGRSSHGRVPVTDSCVVHVGKSAGPRERTRAVGAHFPESITKPYPLDSLLLQ
jgi:hypothetical protein